MSEDLLQTIDEWGPEKVLCVSDRRTGMRGVLVIDNTARGMGKGGTRMSPTLTVGEVARLARTMTWKWAAVDLFFGGAKAGILGDPTSPGREPVLRAFARRLSSEVPREYVLGLDMGLTERDAAIFLDELGERSASVGLPHELGGLPYDQLGVTGHGVAEVIASAAEVTGLRLGDSSVVIQGFGAVGAATARRLAQLGAVVVAVSTSRGAVHDVNGLDVEELLTLRAEFGDACVEHLGRPVLECGAELRLPADVLVPAAMQDVVTGDVARQTTARLVVEAANMPTTPEAKRVLHQRGITVVPDFIANAGGAVAAAFSMDARQSPFRADKDAVFATVSERLASNTAHVLEHAGSHGMTTHDAALDLARHRVRAAMQLRGQARASDGTPQ